jgi:2-polyprenyl-3-methyl-5-hydroxy-6-metoxy-1,4-benzoquinol methylase
MGASKGTHEKVLELLGDIKGEKVLDCGAGKGFFTEQLVNKDGKIYACDINPSRFRLKIPFKKANFNNHIPFNNSSFDKIVSIEVIEHLENPAIFIRELSRVIKKNGQLIITTPNIQNVKSKFQFLFKSEFHWFQKNEFGNKGSRHIHPVYWREIIFLLEKYNFKIDKITENRASGYTLYYTNKDNLFKKISYVVLNFFSDMSYRILSVFMFPKNRSLLLGDILIIKATKK